VQILKELRHPNIVEILRFYPHEVAYYFVVLEFLPGIELFDFIANKVGANVNVDLHGNWARSTEAGRARHSTSL